MFPDPLSRGGGGLHVLTVPYYFTVLFRRSQRGFIRQRASAQIALHSNALINNYVAAWVSFDAGPDPGHKALTTANINDAKGSLMSCTGTNPDLQTSALERRVRTPSKSPVFFQQATSQPRSPSCLPLVDLGKDLIKLDIVLRGIISVFIFRCFPTDRCFDQVFSSHRTR